MPKSVKYPMVFSDVVDFNGINRTINLSVWVLYRLRLTQLHGKCYRCRKLVRDPWMPRQSIKEDTYQLHSTDVRFRRKRVSACYVRARLYVYACVCVCSCAIRQHDVKRTENCSTFYACCATRQAASLPPQRDEHNGIGNLSVREPSKKTQRKPNGKLKTDKTHRWANTTA